MNKPIFDEAIGRFRDPKTKTFVATPKEAGARTTIPPRSR
jgi:hypothetical protein